MKRERLVLLMAVAVVLCVSPSVGFAEEKEVPPGISKKENIPGEGKHKGWEQGKHKGWNKEEWDKLKKEDPEKFKEAVSEHHNKAKQRLEYLKETDPQKYEQIKESNTR